MSEEKDCGFTCYQVGKPYDKVMRCDGAVLEIHENLCMCSIGLTDVSVAEAWIKVNKVDKKNEKKLINTE